MSLTEYRKAIRPLLQENNPADAQAAYYVFHHPDEKTKLVPSWTSGELIKGYVCVSRTGVDLFRPLITMRLPHLLRTNDLDLAAGAELIRQAIPEGMPVIINAPINYQPLLASILEIKVEQRLKLLALDRERFEPMINVLIQKSESYNDLPRFVIRSSDDSHHQGQGEVVASAGINWRSDRFAEIYVYTKNPHRRKGLGRSVVAAIVDSILKNGRTPLYVVQDINQPSISLAESVGFVDTGADQLLIEGHLRTVH